MPRKGSVSIADAAGMSQEIRNKVAKREVLQGTYTLDAGAQERWFLTVNSVGLRTGICS
jgi:hypothetical protein